jgi:hypothetical protein
MSELGPTITKLEPTATERLRALLDERGVEWDADDEAMDDGSLSQVTYWYCNGIEWSADGRDEYLAFDAVQLLTPEQAIAATLGAGTCELVNAAEDLGDGTSSCMCDKCGYTALDDWWDEFNFCPNCGRRVVNDG